MKTLVVGMASPVKVAQLVVVTSLVVPLVVDIVPIPISIMGTQGIVRLGGCKLMAAVVLKVTLMAFIVGIIRTAGHLDLCLSPIGTVAALVANTVGTFAQPIDIVGTVIPLVITVVITVNTPNTKAAAVSIMVIKADILVIEVDTKAAAVSIMVIKADILVIEVDTKAAAVSILTNLLIDHLTIRLIDHLVFRP